MAPLTTVRIRGGPTARSFAMFENQQRDDVEKFIHANAETRRLFYRHQELDTKLHDANIGCLPIDDASLAGLKREKLQAKERLQRMWDTWQKSPH
ncbi:Uncharacterized conserved protein YdcH, DUF465 family [Luteibacter sp. UNC138MFCol5.1]|nr:Uncharacterized conserved protein YdcH, DUF465 family [Luteibacter sp. UNC138MFCol5.1]